MPPPRRDRRGAATVELAICLPLFLVVVAGTVQTCTLIHLRDSLCVASYEAARLMVKGEANRPSAVDRAERILAARGIINPRVDIRPADVSSIDRGDAVTVVVSVPASGHSYLPPLFGRRDISSQTIMFKEKD